jgi:nitrogen regulatory protein P-II 1
MKRIEAFLQPHRVSRVVRALHELPHFPGFTTFEARGHGHGRGADGHYVAEGEGLVYHERQILIVICSDAEADAIVETIVRAAHTGAKHDGIVAVSDVLQVRRIGETSHPSGVQP